LTFSLTVETNNYWEGEDLSPPRSERTTDVRPSLQAGQAEQEHPCHHPVHFSNVERDESPARGVAKARTDSTPIASKCGGCHSEPLSAVCETDLACATRLRSGAGSQTSHIAPLYFLLSAKSPPSKWRISLSSEVIGYHSGWSGVKAS
jgi:hypothetical protein